MTFQPDLNQSIEELRGQLAEWRQSHHAPSRIPPEIWASAAELAVVHGVSKVSQSLKLDYGGLKKRMGGRAMSERPDSPKFYELFPATIGACCLEIESVSGSKLRVELRGISPAVLGSLLKEFGGLSR